MLGLPPSVRIYFATELADMRRGIDGLRAIVEGTLRHDPYGGHIFVFVGKAKDKGIPCTAPVLDVTAPPPQTPSRGQPISPTYPVVPRHAPAR